MATFTFNNTSSGSVCFTYETVRNSNGVYDSASPKAALGSFSSLTGINEDHIVQSDYIWSAVIPEGESSLGFFPETIILPGEVYFRGTGKSTVTMTLTDGTQTLSPSELHGQGTLNSIKVIPAVPPTTTTVTRTSLTIAGIGVFNTETNWNTAITTGSAPFVNNGGFGSLPLSGAGQSLGPGGETYINYRVMFNFNLSEVPGTITAINLPFATVAPERGSASPEFSVNIFSAGTASIAPSVGTQYALYKNEGSTALSSPQAVTSSVSYNFSLNAAALTIANTKPANFVIAVINEFDYTATAPADGSTYFTAINTEPEPHFPLVITSV